MIEIRRLNQLIFRKYVEMSSKLQYGVNYDAPLYPFKLHYIDPKSVDKIQQEKPIQKLMWSGVKDGDWDKKTIPFSESRTYLSMIDRFEKGLDWTETDYFKEGKARIENNKSYKGCDTKKELHQRTYMLDKLYKNIKKYGYHSQRELMNDKQEWQIAGLNILMSRPPEFREITVDVSRCGEFLWFDGVHRLSIAKILNIPKVPIRIRVRHQEWQSVRDNVYLSMDYPDRFKQHPDLVPLID